MSVRRRIETCQRCHLHKGCRRPVPYRGPTPADVALIGEAPGEQEDRAGKPFVGAAGQYLEKIAAQVGLDTRKWFFCNIVSCRPGQNRDPLPAEIKACSLNLRLQLALASPRVVILAGRFALNHFRPDAKITQAHGRPFWIDGVFFYPMLHPAYALRTNDAKDDFMWDLAIFRGQFVEATDPWDGWPEKCETCRADVQRYDEYGVAWCRRHYPKSKVQLEGQTQIALDDRRVSVVHRRGTRPRRPHA